MHDAIIIGAGPAGCAAGKVLSERGFNVLIIERGKLPRYKSCSGVLIEKSIKFTERYFGAIPEKVMCTPTDNYGMVFTTDKGKEFSFPQRGLNVWRADYDGWLAECAERSGANLLDGTVVTDIEDCGDGITVLMCRSGRQFTATAKYAIDCSGAAGVSARGGKREYIATFQTFNSGNINLDPHWFYAYLQPELSEYDAWFNVKDDMLILGVAVKDTKNTAAYYKKFIEYMQLRHGLRIEKELRREKWIMPCVKPECPIDCGSGRIFNAGETAGFLNPMGEGISSALESGAMAAEALAESFDSPESALANYFDSVKKTRGYMRSQWNFTGSLAQTFQYMKIQKGDIKI